MQLKKYSINGWCSLKHKSFIVDHCCGKQNDLDETVTDATIIKIYPDRCYHTYHNDTDENLDQTDATTDDFNRRQYYKEYKSDTGFSSSEIFNLIVKTYWIMINELYDDDRDYISNLSLHTFYFDPNTNRVYAQTDS